MNEYYKKIIRNLVGGDKDDDHKYLGGNWVEFEKTNYRNNTVIYITIISFTTMVETLNY